MIPKYKLASLEALAKKYKATGRVVFIHPKKGTISVNGLSWPWQEAERRMKEIISIKEALKEINLKNPNAPATSNQTWTLRKLTGKDYRERKLTQQQASDLIQQELAKKKKNESSAPILRTNQDLTHSQEEDEEDEGLDEISSNASVFPAPRGSPGYTFFEDEEECPICGMCPCKCKKNKIQELDEVIYQKWIVL